MIDFNQLCSSSCFRFGNQQHGVIFDFQSTPDSTSLRSPGDRSFEIDFDSWDLQYLGKFFVLHLVNVLVNSELLTIEMDQPIGSRGLHMGVSRSGTYHL